MAFAVGLLAVGLAAFQDNIVEVNAEADPTPPDQTLKEVAAVAAKKMLEGKILRKSGSPSLSNNATSSNPSHPHRVIIAGLGTAAIGLGAFAWAQKANTRLAAAAVGLGLVAIAWDWVLAAIAFAAVLFIFSFFS